MAENITGACLCGDVRFEAELEEIRGMNCFCKDCQRATGSTCATFVVVPDAGMKVEGSPQSYTTTADSGGTVTRFFCGHCGSQLWSQVAAMPGATFVKVGVMDDCSACEPQVNIWTASKASWLALDPKKPSFDLSLIHI